MQTNPNLTFTLGCGESYSMHSNLSKYLTSDGGYLLEVSKRVGSKTGKKRNERIEGMEGPGHRKRYGLKMQLVR